jgi:hypothetical protein
LTKGKNQAMMKERPLKDKKFKFKHFGFYMMAGGVVAMIVLLIVVKVLSD